MTAPPAAPNQRVRPVSARLSARGHWTVGGCDLGELADTFGTPLYVMDESTIVLACQDYLSALKLCYPGPCEVLYASKALCNKAINRLIHDQGLATEVVSGGELHTVLEAGVPADRIHFQGNAKSEVEVKSALDAGIARFMVDNLDEIRLLAKLGRPARLILRVAPGVEAHTHDFIKTGRKDSKFGLDLPGQLDEAITLIQAHPNLELKGLQAHIGSQIFDIEPFRAAARLLLDLSRHVRDAHRIRVDEIDVGGGLGIAYTAADDPPTIAGTMEAMADEVVKGCRARGLELPKLIVEPGRSIVGTAGVTVYTVLARKEIPGVVDYVAVDGGMPDNPRTITYGALYQADPVVPGRRRAQTVTLAGRCCEEGDVLIRDCELEALEPGDRVVVWTTGAYNFSMASNYNRYPRPAMALVHDGHAELARARETYADVVSLDRMPRRLATP